MSMTYHYPPHTSKFSCNDTGSIGMTYYVLGSFDVSFIKCSKYLCKLLHVTVLTMIILAKLIQQSNCRVKLLTEFFQPQ